jgi:hypothetical protein
VAGWPAASQFEIQVVVVSTAGVEGCLAVWALVATSQVFIDGELGVAVAAEYGLSSALGPRPHLGRVVGQGIVAGNAGVVLTAALVPDGDNVALRMVVGALGARRNGEA